MPAHTTALIVDGFDDSIGLDTATSRAILDRVAVGEMPETFRISTPGRIVAFGRRDRLESGFGEAVQAARSLGYASVVRLPGGRAAAFHEGVISFSWTTPDVDPVRAIRRRFIDITEILVDALERLGVPAQVGEVPGEYCPGEFSINAGEANKLAGIGQRLVRGAAHIGGVLVVDGGDRVRDVLIPVYEALGLDWDPATVGAVTDLRPGVDTSMVVAALVEALAVRTTIIESALDDSTIQRAGGLADRYLP